MPEAADAPYVSAPPPPARPVQRRRAFGLVRALVAEPKRTELVFELFDAMGGRGDEATFARFAAGRAGRALLAERPSLRAALSDAAALAALPAGSLGRAYLAFAAERGFTPAGLLELNERGLGHVNALLDADRLYFYERANVMHDLWHVVTGYDTDEAGEAALLAFSHAQGLSGRAMKLLIATTLAIGPKRGGLAFQRFVLQAWRRGRRAERLLEAPWEALLALPLGEARRALGVAPLSEAHPGGVFGGALFARRVRV
jgi:ubiquinone biosynthesis protein COQ4